MVSVLDIFGAMPQTQTNVEPMSFYSAMGQPELAASGADSQAFLGGQPQPISGGNTTNLAKQVQQMLEGKQAGDPGAVQGILSGRFDQEQQGPSFGDYIQSAIGSLNGAYKPAGDIASSKVAQQLALIQNMEQQSQDPASVREYQYYNALPEAEKNKYLEVKRGEKWLNTGGGFTQPATGSYIPKTAPPQEMPDFRANQTRAVENAKTESDRRANYTKAQGSLVAAQQQSDILMKNINDAIKLSDSFGSTGYGHVLTSGLPNTNARALDNAIQTIRSNNIVDSLQQMRQNSPTGGALGNVSNYEDQMLGALNGALDPLQKDSLKDNLAILRITVPLVLAERQRAFQQDYGVFSPVGDNPMQPNDNLPSVTDATTRVPQFSSPNDPVFQQMPSGAKFRDSNGVLRTKH